MILLIATTFFVNTIVARSSEVYPVHRQDFVSNGQPSSLPYQIPRQDGVYRVSRQDFGSPRQQVQYPYKIDSRNDPGAIQYWYPGPVSYDYQNNYPNTISAPSVLRNFPVIPNLFVPAPNQVFKVNVDNAIPTGQPSTSRPRSSSTKSPFQDDSVLPAIPKSSVDEGEPLSALSDYSKKGPGRPIRYIPVNDDVEINEEQKDLLKSHHSPSANKKERSRFPPRVRRRAPYNNDERFCQEHHDHRFFHRIKKYPQFPKNVVTTEAFDGSEPQLDFGLKKDNEDVLSDLMRLRAAFPEDLLLNDRIIPAVDEETTAPELTPQERASIDDENVLAELRSPSGFQDENVAALSNFIQSRIVFPEEFLNDRTIPAVDEKTSVPELTSKQRESIENENSVIPGDVPAGLKELLSIDKIIPIVDEETTASELTSQERALIDDENVLAKLRLPTGFPDEDFAAVSNFIQSRIVFPDEFLNDKTIPAADEETITPELTSQERASIDDEKLVTLDDVSTEPRSRIAFPDEDVAAVSDVIHSRIAFPKDLFWNDKIIPAVDEKTIAPELASKERESIENENSVVPDDVLAELKELLSNDKIIPTVGDEKMTASKFMPKELVSNEDNDSLAPGDASAVMSMIFDVLRYSGTSSNEVDSDYGRETGASGSVEIIPNRAALNFHRGVKSPATATKDYENLTLKDLLAVISHAIDRASDLTDEELELLELIRRHMLDENDSLNTQSSELDEKVKLLLSHSAEKYNSIEESLKRQANTLKMEEKGGVLSYKPSLTFIDELEMMKSALLSEMEEDENKSSDDVMVLEQEPEVLLHLQKK